MVGHMRKRRHVHALEAEPVLQTGPHRGDLCGVPLVEERDNPVHTYPLSAFSWAAASLSPRYVPAIPFPARLPPRRVSTLLRPPRQHRMPAHPRGGSACHREPPVSVEGAVRERYPQVPPAVPSLPGDRPCQTSPSTNHPGYAWL